MADKDAGHTKASGRDRTTHKGNGHTNGAAGGHSTAGTKPSKPQLAAKPFSSIELEEVQWIWKGFLSRGALAILAGEPGAGKSTVSAAIAACISRGSDWPISEIKAPLGRVLIISDEDDPGNTIGPRLVAAGANMENVSSIDARMFDIASVDGLKKLSNIAKAIPDLQLIILDAISVILDKNVNASQSIGMRRALRPVLEIAKDCNACMLAITHFRKPDGGKLSTRAIHRVLDSIAIVALARTVMAVTTDPNDLEGERKFLSSAKANNTKRPRTHPFRIIEAFATDTKTGRPIETSVIDWDKETVDLSADEAIATETDTSNKTIVAEIMDQLASSTDGMTPKEMHKALDDHEHNVIRMTMARMVKANKLVRSNGRYWTPDNFEIAAEMPKSGWTKGTRKRKTKPRAEAGNKRADR